MDLKLNSHMRFPKKVKELKYGRELTRPAVNLDARESACRFREGDLTNWICDVLAEEYSDKVEFHPTISQFSFSLIIISPSQTKPR